MLHQAHNILQEKKYEISEMRSVSKSRRRYSIKEQGILAVFVHSLALNFFI